MTSTLTVTDRSGRRIGEDSTMGKRAATLLGVQESYFDPSAVALLVKVVEEALEELAARSGSLADPIRRELTRELIAHRVMARAARGERDPQRLREHALWDM